MKKKLDDLREYWGFRNINIYIYRYSIVYWLSKTTVFVSYRYYGTSCNPRLGFDSTTSTFKIKFEVEDGGQIIDGLPQ